MNSKMVLRSLGILLICEAIAIFPSLLVSFIYKDGCFYPFIYTIVLLALLGCVLRSIKPGREKLYAKDGFAIVAFGWVMVSFFGSLPYCFSGSMPSLIDCFFEGVSGFTTTGASLFKEMEGLPQSLVFWRSFTHWIGGMGVLILTMAILPSMGRGAIQIMKAESPGPNPSKLVPKLDKTAKLLYGIYLALTIVLIALLFIFGMPLYDSFIHAFGTVATGGCSNMNTSIAGYNNIIIEVIIIAFMLICGSSFSLHYQFIKGNRKSYIEDWEFLFYIGLIFISIVLVSLNLYTEVFDSMGESIRHSSFQVVSIATTTGYNTRNFDNWPQFSKMVLFFLMFIGGSANSTAGGIKTVRLLLLLKCIKIELKRIIHPKAVYPLRIGDRVIDEKVLSGIKSFFFVYILVFAITAICISRDGFDIATTLSSSVAAIGNTGVGFGMIGPRGNYSIMSNLSKITLSIAMLLGRLEIYPILLLTMPNFWRRVNP